MAFSRQEYWSGLPCPPPGDLPHPGTKPASLVSPAWAGRLFTTSATWEAIHLHALSRSVMTNSVTHGLQPARLLCPRDSPGKNTGVGIHFPSPGDLPNPGIKPRSPATADGFFTDWASREARYNPVDTRHYNPVDTHHYNPGDTHPDSHSLNVFTPNPLPHSLVKKTCFFNEQRIFKSVKFINNFSRAYMLWSHLRCTSCSGGIRTSLRSLSAFPKKQLFMIRSVNRSDLLYLAVIK